MRDIEDLYGKFEEYKSFRDIIELEFERFKTTLVKQRDHIKKLLKKNKGVLRNKDWIELMTTKGLNVDMIS